MVVVAAAAVEQVVAAVAVENVGKVVAAEAVAVVRTAEVLDRLVDVARRFASVCGGGEQVGGHASRRSRVRRDVGANAAVEQVGAEAARERIVADAAEDLVRAAVAVEDVVVARAEHHVGGVACRLRSWRRRSNR